MTSSTGGTPWDACVNRWGRYGLLTVAATVSALVGLVIVFPGPPSASVVVSSPTPDWAKCTPNAARACTTLDGIALGPFRASMSLDTQPCDDCRDQPGTARAALERLAPHHPPLTGIDLFSPDLRALCGDTRCIADVSIFVFAFSDATLLPIVVSCAETIGSVCEQVDHYGPP
jgi:hypothetical protein